MPNNATTTITTVRPPLIEANHSKHQVWIAYTRHQHNYQLANEKVSKERETKGARFRKFGSVCKFLLSLLDSSRKSLSFLLKRHTQFDLTFASAVIMIWHDLCIVRGECSGRSGIFPSSFVRIIDSFPGDTPGPGTDSSSYLRAELSSGHEYDNTRWDIVTIQVQVLVQRFQKDLDWLYYYYLFILKN